MIENQTGTAWQRIWVTIEAGGDPIDPAFPAWTRGNRWNGFETPYFDFATARKVAKWTESFPAAETEIVRWDDDRSLFIGTGVFGDEPYEQAYGPTNVPGVGPCYAIGAWAWAWNRLPDTEEVRFGTDL